MMKIRQKFLDRKQKSEGRRKQTNTDNDCNSFKNKYLWVQAKWILRQFIHCSKN